MDSPEGIYLSTAADVQWDLAISGHGPVQDQENHSGMVRFLDLMFSFRLCPSGYDDDAKSKHGSVLDAVLQSNGAMFGDKC